VTPEEVVKCVGAVTGTVFTYGGRCRGGQVGAHYAADSSGNDYVFKWFEGVSDGDRRMRIPDRVERLRARGYPAPRYLSPNPLRRDAGTRPGPTMAKLWWAFTHLEAARPSTTDRSRPRWR
jgi:hypothetical protein